MEELGTGFYHALRGRPQAHEAYDLHALEACRELGTLVNLAIRYLTDNKTRVRE